MASGRKFPANKITWDNYKWAVRYSFRFTELRWALPLLAQCRQLRDDARAGRL